MSSAELYDSYKTKMQKIADVKYAAAILEWDQETYMPVKGSDFRGRQIATLNEIAHSFLTDEALGSLLLELNSCKGLDAEEKRNAELSLEDYQRNKNLTPAFVRKRSEAIHTAYHAWVKARKANDSTIFQEPLQQLITLKRQQADLIGYEVHPYNALMSEYDKGLTVEIVDAIFKTLQPALTELLDFIQQQPQVDDSFLHQLYDKDCQWKYGLSILKKIGFDFESGRQDISIHPFTTNFSNADVRVTTRIDENNFSNMAWSCIHEGGHALYEQGLPAEHYGLPLGEYCSLSIHESQSRIWENNVGRSQAFWQHNFPILKTFFPEQLRGVTAHQFFKGINKVQPSLIRTEADELTYHFHVMIRYEIEKLLIEGNITAKDISPFWNELYKKYLGVTVPDDLHGYLQDIHWSHGSFGYFATYSTGSLYAAQLYAAIEKEYAAVEEQITLGNTNMVLEWLRKNIHSKGRFYTSEALCKEATRSYLDANFFTVYATKKYQDIYSS
jgi:carboxypeptidase Taq